MVIVVYVSFKWIYHVLDSFFSYLNIYIYWYSLYFFIVHWLNRPTNAGRQFCPLEEGVGVRGSRRDLPSGLVSPGWPFSSPSLENTSLLLEGL